MKLGPDVYNGPVDAYSGYLPSGNITGFSMLHESGTGGAPKYGVVAQMPVVGNLSNLMTDNYNDTRAAKDFTEVGYYRSQLSSGTAVELAAANKAGMFKYTFPKTDKSKNVFVDVSHVLFSYRGQGLGQNWLGGTFGVSRKNCGPSLVYYTGSGTYDNVSILLCDSLSM